MKIVTRNINTSPFSESLGIPGYYYARCRLMAFLCKNASTFSADERKLAFCRRNLEDETKIERHFLSAAKLHASSVKKAGLQSPTATSLSDENGLNGLKLGNVGRYPEREWINLESLEVWMEVESLTEELFVDPCLVVVGVVWPSPGAGI